MSTSTQDKSLVCWKQPDEKFVRDWLKEVSAFVQREVKTSEGVSVWQSKTYLDTTKYERLGILPYDMPMIKLDGYCLKCYAEKGGSEGHYVTLEACKRSKTDATETRFILLTSKTFAGLEEALRMVASITRAITD